MLNDFTIRIASPRDAPAISKVIHDSFLQFKQFYTEEAFAATAVSANEILQRMNEGNVWVAEKDDIVTGTVGVIRKGKSLYIRGMAVLPGGRSLGIGWKFLETIQQHAVENNFETLTLSTTPYLPSAIHLYKKFGFKQEGDMDDSFYGTLIFKMKKILS